MIYSPAEVAILREGGRRLALHLARLAALVRPGLASSELEQEARRLIAHGGDEPSFLGYQGAEDTRPFPAALCVSFNDEVVHGVPTKEKIIREEMLVTLDLGLRHAGFCIDAAVTIAVGEVPPAWRSLVEATRRALEVAVGAARVGATVGDIGYAVELFVRGVGGLGIVRDLSGHGVGREVHEEPLVPNYGKPGAGARLEEGTVLALEPMLTLGAEKTKLGPDGFAYCTVDGSVAAHFEQTIVVKKDGAEILTTFD
jgi:methionyl aminopeptidase